MMKDNNSNWNPILFAMLHLLAAILLISWMWPATRGGWDAIDFSIFKTFDNRLRCAGRWQVFWAITNWRLFDAVQFTAVFGIAFYWLFANDKRLLKQRIMEFSFFIATCLFVSFLFHETIFILDYHRTSPTKTIEGAFRISRSVTWLATKDFSNDAFPGDHGFVLICAMTFFWVKGGARLGWFSSILLAPFLFPRLVVGSHWATDILVGSFSMSLVTIGLFFATPLQSTMPLWSANKLDKYFPQFLPFTKGSANR